MQLRKALYAFDGQHPDDLTLHVGDIITVLDDRIDQGWWLGETEHNNQKKCGIFPVNYTGAWSASDDPPPLPPKDLQSIRASPHYYEKKLPELKAAK